MGSNGDQWRFNLWETYNKLWKDPPFLMGKSTISMGNFSIAM